MPEAAVHLASGKVRELYALDDDEAMEMLLSSLFFVSLRLCSST